MIFLLAKAIFKVMRTQSAEKRKMDYKTRKLENNLKIGILGGIGPEASAEFYYRLIKELQDTGLIKSNKDFPQIIINSIPAPELVGDEISFSQLAPYRDGLRELNEFRVDLIVMICNTIYLFYNELQKITKVPILDLKSEVKRKIENERFRKLAIIGTPKTIKGSLYRFNGIKYISLSDKEIRQISAAIFSYNKGEDKAKQRQIVEQIARRCLSKGADTIVLACTETAMMLEKADIPKIDTIDLLVQSVVEFYQRMKLPLPVKNESERH